MTPVNAQSQDKAIESTSSDECNGSNTSSDSTSSDGSTSAKSACTGPKLTPAGAHFIIHRILHGDTNKEINAALVAEGHLKTGQSISVQTLRKYRRRPEAQFERITLTDEARQAGHLELSRGVLRAMERSRESQRLFVQEMQRALEPSEEARAEAEALTVAIATKDKDDPTREVDQLRLKRLTEQLTPNWSLIKALGATVESSDRFLWSILGPGAGTAGTPALVISEQPEPEKVKPDPNVLRAQLLEELAASVKRVVRRSQEEKEAKEEAAALAAARAAGQEVPQDAEEDEEDN